MTKATPNRDLVVWALHLLGGAVSRVHTEDIARKAHELFPDSFSWTRYPELPDKDIVRVALTDARKPKYGALIEGRTGQHRGHSGKTKRGPQTDGWTLTAAGAKWVLSNQKRLEGLGRSVGLPKEHRQKVLKKLARIRSHRLFAEFIKDPAEFSPEIGALAELFRCRVDASREIWEARLEAVRKMGRISEQKDVLRFTDACEAAYRTQL